jgi:glutamate-1-semialdehyde 2,1-aminomutase
MLRRTDEETVLFDKAQRYLPGGNLGHAALFARRLIMRTGKGSRVWDVSGNEYIDYLLGAGPMILGHAHPVVTGAVRDYLHRGGPFFIDNEPAILLAEEISKAVRCAEKIRFTTSGTDATFQCLRLARAYRQRERILKFEGGYHGMHDYALQSMAPKSHRLKPFPDPVPDSAGIPKGATDSVLIAPFNDLDTTGTLIEQYHNQLAGVIVEPLQRIIPPVAGFLQGLRELTARYGVPLIFDEIVTGFRLAFGGAQEYYEVVPDLVALGKTASGGYPLAIIAGRADIMKHYDQGLEGTDDFVPAIVTYGAHPVCAVAALATINELKKPGTYERMFATGRRLRQELHRLLMQAGISHQIPGEDVLFDVVFTDREIVSYRDVLAGDAEKAKVWDATLIENGVFKARGKVYVGACHTEEDVKQTIAAFEKAAEAIRRLEPAGRQDQS